MDLEHRFLDVGKQLGEIALKCLQLSHEMMEDAEVAQHRDEESEFVGTYFWALWRSKMKSDFVSRPGMEGAIKYDKEKSSWVNSKSGDIWYAKPEEINATDWEVVMVFSIRQPLPGGVTRA